jgi:hypothetical protein
MQNVIDYLVAALTNSRGRGGVFEIGGPDVTTYGDLMLRYARLRGLHRRLLLLPGIPLWFMAFGVGLTTPVPYPIAYALIGGLSADSVVRHPEARIVFPEVELIDFDDAARDALHRTHPAHIERVWAGSRRGAVAIKHEGCFIDHREVQVDAEPERLLGRLGEIVKKRNLRELTRTDDLLMVCAKDQAAGEEWIEWRIVSSGSKTRLTQTVFFRPHGLPGFLHWFLLYPLRMAAHRRLIRAIARI